MTDHFPLKPLCGATTEWTHGDITLPVYCVMRSEHWCHEGPIVGAPGAVNWHIWRTEPASQETKETKEAADQSVRIDN
ncbi:hypothetical protein ACGFIF_42870 [Kribbella sp. NPDC049174]|uniref:hypothetical protein n=1 Tax=Kribbella sp. NPDC049174 TaxID=3364112 RepID=UPI00371AA437